MYLSIRGARRDGEHTLLRFREKEKKNHAFYQGLGLVEKPSTNAEWIDLVIYGKKMLQKKLGLIFI